MVRYSLGADIFFFGGGTVHWIIYYMKFNKLNKFKESI